MKPVVPVALALVLAATIFAGCLQFDEESIPSDVLQARVAPEWEIGHWWTYETNVWGEITLVVFEDHGDYWHLETTNPDLAWEHLDDPISFLDMVNKSNLAGSQEEEVRYFDFPLEEGKNWTTHWTGYDLLIEVKWMNETGIHLHGYHPDGWHRLSYDYDPQVGWFTDMVVYDEDHEAIYEVDYVDHGTAFSDEVARWTSSEATSTSLTAPAGTEMSTFTVAEGTTVLFAEYEWDCEDQTGEYTVRLYPSDAGPLDAEAVEGECGDEPGTLEIDDPQPGEWVLQFAFATAPEFGEFKASAHTRTLEWLALDTQGEETQEED